MEKTILLFLSTLALASGTIKVYTASGDGCDTMFYTETFKVTTADGSVDLNDEDSYTGSCSSTGPTMSIAFKNVTVGSNTYSALSVTMTFSTTDTGYWSSKTVDISYTNAGSVTTGTGKFNSASMISQDFSFACTTLTTYTLSNEIELELEKYQMQAVEVQNTKFAEAYQCINWISKGAWMGIFTGVILILTAVFSVIMLMNIATPDRSETSKSKCLIIPHEH